MVLPCGITRRKKYNNYVICYPIRVSSQGRSDSLLVEVDEFDHVDPKGVRDIHEFGKIKPVLAGFVVENECFRFAKSGGKLFCCQAFRLPGGGEDFGENADAALVMREEIHKEARTSTEILPSDRLAF